MDNKVSNPKTEVPTDINMNDCDNLMLLLNIEKNLCNNYNIALNEASNDTLYNELFTIYNETHDMQRKLYNLAFKKGWYVLEKAEANKINEKLTMFNEKLNELS